VFYPPSLSTNLKTRAWLLLLSVPLLLRSPFVTAPLSDALQLLNGRSDCLCLMVRVLGGLWYQLLLGMKLVKTVLKYMENNLVLMIMVLMVL
jgi:hypothetical protein